MKAAQRGLGGLLFLPNRHLRRLPAQVAPDFFTGALNTFREKYCESRRCRPEEFPTRIFWRCLHPHAVPFVPFLSALQSDYFAPDRDLILNVSRARSMRELDEEIRDYMKDSRNYRWWRMRAHVRLSTQRLRRLARPYFPEEDSAP